MGKSNYSDQAIAGYLRGSGNNNKSAYGALSNQYKDLINQPTATDSIADAFSNAGNTEARGPAQRESNALQRGLGAGIKAYANDQRASKLSGLEQQTASLLETNAMLEQQMADTNVNRQKINQFFQQSSVNIMELSKASMAGDTNAANSLAQNILRTYKEITGDPTVGEFDHFHNGTMYYINPETGNVEGRNIVSSMYQAGIDPVEQFGPDAVPTLAGLSSGAALNYKNSEEERGLKLQGERANINFTNARTASLNNDMNAPKPKYNDAALTSITKENTEWVNKLRDEHKRLNKEKHAYEQLAKIIDEERGAWGRGGASILSQAQRAFNKAGTASEKNQILAELYKQPLMAGMKQIFTGATSDKDIEHFIAGLPSLDKNPEASIQVARERAADIEQIIEDDNLTRDVLENDYGFSEPYNSLAVQKRVEERKPMKAPQRNSGKTESNNYDLRDLQ